jgi:hypothetical protein
MNKEDMFKTIADLSGLTANGNNWFSSMLYGDGGAEKEDTFFGELHYDLDNDKLFVMTKALTDDEEISTNTYNINSISDLKKLATKSLLKKGK